MAIRKPPKFSFKTVMERAIARLGGKPNQWGEVEVPTRAGALSVTVLDNWVATRFLDVDAARTLGLGDRLNPYSGKWNWHPGELSDLEAISIFDRIARVVKLESEELADLQESFEDEAQHLSPAEETFMRLTYQYQDGEGNKSVRVATMPLGTSNFQNVQVMLLAMARRNGLPSFIPGQVGLSDLQDCFGEEDAYWDDDKDHPWHEIVSIEPLRAREHQNAALESITFVEFRQRVLSTALIEGWNEAHLPACHDLLKERGESRRHEERRSMACC